MMSDRISINSEIRLAGANCLCGYKSRSWERWQSLIFIPPTPPLSHPECWISDWILNTWKSTYLAAWSRLQGGGLEREGSFRVGISPWGCPAAGGHQGCLSLLGACPSTLSSALRDSPASFAAGGSRPACHVSVENCRAPLQGLEPVWICPLPAVPPRCTRRAGWLLALLGSWPSLTSSLGLGCPIHLPWKAQAVLGDRGAAGVARPSRCQAGQISVPALLPGRSGGSDGELGWWERPGKVCGCCRARWDLPLVPRVTAPSGCHPPDLDTHIYKTKIKQRSNAAFPGTLAVLEWPFHALLSHHVGVPLCWSPPWWSHVCASIVRLEIGNFWIWAVLGSISQMHTLTAALPCSQHVLNQLDK